MARDALRAARRLAAGHRRRDQAGVPAARARVPPRRESRRPERGRALQGDQRRVRDGARSGAAPPVRHVRPGRRRAARPATRSRRVSSASTISSTRSSAATCSAAAGRPARDAAPTPRRVMELTLAEVVTGARRTVEMRMPVECETCGGSGGMPGTHPTRCAHVRRRRRGSPGPALAARPDRDRRAVPGVRRDSGPRSSIPCPTCRGDGRVAGTRSIEVEVPAGIDDGQRLRLAGRGPAAPRGGERRRPLRRGARACPTRAFERRGDDLWHRLPVSIVQAALGAHGRARDARRLARARRAVGHAARRPHPAARARRAVAAQRPARRPRGRGRRAGPDQSHARAGRAARAARGAPRRGGHARRTKGCSRASGRPSGRDAGRRRRRRREQVGRRRRRGRARLRRRPRRLGRDHRRRRPPSATGAPAPGRRARDAGRRRGQRGAATRSRPSSRAGSRLGARERPFVEPEIVPRVVARGRAHQGRRARHGRRAVHRARRRPRHADPDPALRRAVGRAAQAERAVERLRRTAREAAAQSRRARLPEIAPVADLARSSRGSPASWSPIRGGATSACVATSSAPSELPTDGVDRPGRPEGGLDPAELELLHRAPAAYRPRTAHSAGRNRPDRRRSRYCSIARARCAESGSCEECPSRVARVESAGKHDFHGACWYDRAGRTTGAVISARGRGVNSTNSRTT